MVKRRSETERSTDRSIDRPSANEATPARLPTPPRLPRPPEPNASRPPEPKAPRPPEPKAPRPLDPKPPRLPDHPVARPGRRGEAPSELVMTHRIERINVEPTPAPLPPSPAAADAERWFEQVPTNPGVPKAHPERRSSGRIPPLETAQQPAQRGAPTWLFPLLLALTALTVGMVIGALVFGRASAHDCPSCSDAGSSR